MQRLFIKNTNSEDTRRPLYSLRPGFAMNEQSFIIVDSGLLLVSPYAGRFNSRYAKT
jgi:hypothetical protein